MKRGKKGIFKPQHLAPHVGIEQKPYLQLAVTSTNPQNLHPSHRGKPVNPPTTRQPLARANPIW